MSEEILEDLSEPLSSSLFAEDFIKRARENPYKMRGPFRVLDIGSGKGGDLMKWQKGNIQHLVSADIAEISLEQVRNVFVDPPSPYSGDVEKLCLLGVSGNIIFFMI